MYDLDRRCPEGCAPKFKDVVLSVKSLHCADEIKLRGVICLQPLQAGKGPRQRGAEGALVSVRPIVSFICGCALKSAAGDASPTGRIHPWHSGHLVEGQNFYEMVYPVIPRGYSRVGHKCMFGIWN